MIGREATSQADAAPRTDEAAGVPRILIVDDQAMIGELLVDALTDAGYEPTHIGASSQAAEVAVETRPDLIVLDIMMPGMSGWEVLERLRENPTTRETPVLITSAMHDRVGRRRLPPGGPIQFHPKPFDFDSLLVAITTLIGS